MIWSVVNDVALLLLLALVSLLLDGSRGFVLIFAQHDWTCHVQSRFFEVRWTFQLPLQGPRAPRELSSCKLTPPVQVRFHPNVAWSSLARTGGIGSWPPDCANDKSLLAPCYKDDTHRSVLKACGHLEASIARSMTFVVVASFGCHGPGSSYCDNPAAHDGAGTALSRRRRGPCLGHDLMCLQAKLRLSTTYINNRKTNSI